MPRVHPCCRRRGWVFFALLLLAPTALFAGGGPFNTLVVVNTNSEDSVDLGGYYAAAHGIPAHHICRLGIDTNLQTLSSNEFRSLLLSPITNHIAAENLDGQIDFLVLCQDFPTRVNDDLQGLSASLFYGPRYSGSSGCAPPIPFTHNEYYRAERAFHSADGWSSTNGFVAFHLVAADLDTAKAVADRGAAARSSFPSAAIYLHMLGGRYRRVREALYANAQFSFTALPGLPVPCVLAPHYTNLNGQTNVMGYQDGYGYIPDEVRTNNVWMPGAYADHLTSCGGMIPDPCFNQATVLDWMDIGATASFGTVAEPCNYLAKFPDPLMAFYYARGFTIGEAYSMSVESPYQGLFAGDPLAAPFAAPPVLSCPSHSPYQIVTGSVPVQVSAAAHSRGVPAAALDFYLAGRFLTNLATLGPTPGNRLSIVVDGLTNSVAVETNDTLFAAVSNLADAVNADPASIVSARAFGDRLELIYTNFNHAADLAPVSASVSTGTASALTLGVGLAATNLIPSVYPARKQIWISEHVIWSGANTNDTLTCVITLTNGVAVTNTIVAAQGESVTNLLVRLGTSINAHPTLQATNGVRFDYLAYYLPNVAEDGALFARKPGPDGSKILVDFTIAPADPDSGLSTNGTFSGALDDYAEDLRPHASVLFHVRPTNGVLAASASFDATALPDDVYTLDFVARDGSAVAASARFSLPLVVCNSSAQLALLGTNGAAVADGAAPALAAGTDFGPVEWGQSLTNTFAILNNGSATLAITSWTTNGPDAASFQVAGLPATVAAGGSSNFLVVFSPASGGAYEASLAFDSDAIVPQTNLLFAGTGAPRGQTIDFPPIADQLATHVVGLSATATSGLDVSFSVASGPASIADGTNLSFSSHGTVEVVAAQSGDADWNPAPEVTNTFLVHGIPTVGPATVYRETNQPLLHVPDLAILTNSVDPEGSDLSVTWVSAASTNGGTVALSNRWITYTAPDGDDSTDYFGFRVDNEFGGEAESTVEVVAITPENEGSALNVVSVTPSDSNTLVRFVGIPLRSYDVQFTTNLIQPWQTVGNTNIGVLGYAIFDDTNEPLSPQYYRTRKPD